jgi:hypothetical protein
MDSEVCLAQVASCLLTPILFILLELSVLVMSNSMMVYTCLTARKVKIRGRLSSQSQQEIQIQDEELDNEVKFLLDNKYSSMPDEYVKQTMEFMQNKRRVSSNSSDFSSMTSFAQCSRSDSEAVLDNGYEKTVSNRKSSLKQTLEIGKSRRISWPDEEKKERDEIEKYGTLKHFKNYNNSNSGLEVIFEYEH